MFSNTNKPSFAFTPEQFIQHPHRVMEELIKKESITNPSEIHARMSQLYSNYFLKSNDEQVAMNIIPSLNSMSAPNTVVRYRGIIQDMNNSELFTGSNLYRENSFVGNGEENNNLMERMLFYCIPIPGEAKWSRNTFYDDIVATNDQTSSSNAIPSEEGKDVKRKRNDEDDEEDEMVETDDLVEPIDSKRRRETTSCHLDHSTPSKTISREEMLDFPIKGEKGLACMVKLYDEECDLKNAEIVDFVGIVTYEENVMRDEQDDDEFFGIFTPEATLVPRLHVLFYKKYQHISDIVPDIAPIATTNDFANVRESLIDYLSLCLKEDKLAAELLLLHLISRVRAHNFDVTLGKFVLNIHNCDNETAHHVYSCIHELVPASHFYELSNENLETTKLIPYKDYSSDKLKTGLLQLSPGTHLVLNENALHEGNLGEKALKNIGALSKLIASQKVDYDFSYHPITMNVDIPVLILSQAKSLFRGKNVNCEVKFSPPTSALSNSEIPSSSTLNSNDMLQMFRSFISHITRKMNREVMLSEEFKTIASTTFVNAKTKDTSVNENTLHNWITLAELINASYGKIGQEIDDSIWRRVMEIDEAIKKRVQ